jgi:glycosyltransferase involved in cell wall biosynthesis
MATSHQLTSSKNNTPEEENKLIRRSIPVLETRNKGNKPYEILFISSYPPRECGIATYTQDLINALETQFIESFHPVVCALESDHETHHYNEEPKFILHTSERNSFTDTTFKINFDPHIKLVVFQHEFGLFASQEEAFFEMLEKIQKPILFVFHTVLPTPDHALKCKVQNMALIASALIVMTNNAASLLINEYEIDASKINIIPHGTHLVPSVDCKKLKKQYHLSGRKILSTFGLLGPSKSIETTLQALPEIIKHYPDVLFLILGKTHPSILKKDGEDYRLMLEETVKELKIENNVMFINEYLQLPTLLNYLQLTDIYLFTSKDRNQAVSGTFSYAISSGCPIISTAIPHAKEVLKIKNGVIIDFESPKQLSEAVIALLNNDKLRLKISLNSFHEMAVTAWQNSAIAHALLFNSLFPEYFPLAYELPAIRLDHIKRMTTDFGMIQFAKMSHPDIHSGYTLDDNARALITLCKHYELFGNESDLEYIDKYLRFIKFCLQNTGRFLNYVNEKNEFTHQNHTENLEDSNGRAIWALGYVSSLKSLLPLYLTTAAEILLQKTLPHVEEIHSTRAMAFVIKGLYYQNNYENKKIIETLADRIMNMYLHEKTDQWQWYENYLTYGNSLLPEAMLLAYLSTKNENYKKIAEESFEFLLSKIFVEGKIKVISNNGWLYKDLQATSKIGGEQPIDVAYTIMALELFYEVFKKGRYKEMAKVAFQWFLGNNHLHQIVYNPVTGGCYDGVEEHNVNLNQGAESTLSYIMSRLSLHSIVFNKKNILKLSRRKINSKTWV